MVCGIAMVWPFQNATSEFGAFLDPVADKLMVATVLILLSSQPVAAGTMAGNTWLMPIATIGADGCCFVCFCVCFLRGGPFFAQFFSCSSPGLSPSHKDVSCCERVASGSAHHDSPP